MKCAIEACGRPATRKVSVEGVGFRLVEIPVCAPHGGQMAILTSLRIEANGELVARLAVGFEELRS